MYMALSPGALGLRVGSLSEAIDLAKSAGYGGVEVGIHEVASLVDARGAESVRAMFDEAGVRPAGWGMPVKWNGSEEEWRQGVDELGRLAKAAQAIGCPRTMTWVLSGSNDRPYEDNRRYHVERFKPIAEVLGAHDCRLGLEFLGPRHIRAGLKHPFIYKLGDMLELGAEIGPNVGLLLDAWHWYTSEGTLDDLRALRPEHVVYVHINDAPPGVRIEDHIDNQRCLPGATGVIDLVGFLRALAEIGYDGPVTPEPFGGPATWAADGLRRVWEQAGL
ncbi:MAG: sugar phosphate isomerase/epimerase [Chthonomonadales bacterium]|nr:sugar phosphate isomerase/epimerase [Chthonomonadales bacterium]